MSLAVYSNPLLVVYWLQILVVLEVEEPGKGLKWEWVGK